VIRSWRRLITWDRRRLLGELPPASRVLEIGSGRGELLAALAAEGHRVSGAEPAAAVRRAPLGGRVAVSDLPLERLEQQPASLDRIVLWHVLEHLDEPREALERVRPWLAPGGRLIVAVPNLGSLQAAIGGDRWFHQDVPRHSTQFTAGGLGQLLHRTGFEPRRRPRPLMDQNPLGMWLTLLNRLTTDSNVPFRLVKRTQGHEGQAGTVRDLAVTALAGPLLLVPAVVAELVATACGRGGSLVVEAAPSSE
jgi:SAM-dependent methyltransferase